MHRLFDHEKLEVYRASLAFLLWLEPVPRKLPKFLECAASLDVLRSKGRCSEEALIKANSDYRLHDRDQA